MMKPKIPLKPRKKDNTRPREELLDATEYLRAENDYLKKRRALIQVAQAAAQKQRNSRGKRGHTISCLFC
ncbi:hypothetical protein [Herbaspirillum camelliae]|uniref:hypothetical protein n=1 Tax=Herbaspirillum camelliae TaxID=1892903 RepID=UPI000A7D0B6A|nr:hypothetical protein [Herbaspirillum camelliae]